ncbi:MAG: MarR family transcriptional regulator [Thermoleophilia bacterium]|nr:MarR family transcriptional regulator [Thermoleophilia bacterium]
MKQGTFDDTVISLMQGDVADLGDDPAHALRLVLRLAGALDAFHARMRHDLQLQVSEYASLLALWDGGRCSLSQLSARVELSRAAMTALVDRLEGMRLVRRVPSPTDRRVVLVALDASFEERLLEQADGFAAALSGLAIDDPAAWRSFAETVAAVRTAALEVSTGPRRAGDDAATFARRPRQVRRFVRQPEVPPSW